jgi:hypothetical protein
MGRSLLSAGLLTGGIDTPAKTFVSPIAAIVDVFVIPYLCAFVTFALDWRASF